MVRQIRRITADNPTETDAAPALCGHGVRKGPLIQSQVGGGQAQS